MSRKSAEENQRRRVTAEVDRLALVLSRSTGTEFIVHRGPVIDRVRRYMLSAQRGGVRYVFQSYRQGCSRQEMQYWLASLCDMVAMGFIPTAQQERDKIVEFLSKNYESAATDNSIPVNAADMINTVRICIEEGAHT